MQSGAHTVGDGMRRHLISLERERRNLEHSMELCRTLKDRGGSSWTTWRPMNCSPRWRSWSGRAPPSSTASGRDTKRVRYVAPAVVTVLTVLLMAGLIALMLYSFSIEEEPVPMPLVVVLVAIPGVVIFGVLLAVAQRFREIEKGEADDAKQY